MPRKKHLELLQENKAPKALIVDGKDLGRALADKLKSKDWKLN